MNNTRQLYQIFDNDIEVLEVSDKIHDSCISLLNNEGKTLLAILTIPMAEDLRDCLDELIRRAK